MPFSLIVSPDEPHRHKGHKCLYLTAGSLAELDLWRHAFQVAIDSSELSKTDADSMTQAAGAPMSKATPFLGSQRELPTEAKPAAPTPAEPKPAESTTTATRAASSDFALPPLPPAAAAATLVLPSPASGPPTFQQQGIAGVARTDARCVAAIDATLSAAPVDASASRRAPTTALEIRRVQLELEVAAADVTSASSDAAGVGHSGRVSC